MEFDVFLEDRPVDLEMALSAEHGRLAVRPRGADFFAVTHEPAMQKPVYMFIGDPLADVAGRMSYIQLTARSEKEYMAEFGRKYPQLDMAAERARMAAARCIVEVGPAVSQMAVNIAQERHALGLSPYIIIEPLDYAALGGLIGLIVQKLPKHELYMRVLDNPTPEEMLERIRILSNPEYVTQFRERLGFPLHQSYSHLGGTADYLIDFAAALHYSGDDPKILKACKSILNRRGRLLQLSNAA